MFYKPSLSFIYPLGKIFSDGPRAVFSHTFLRVFTTHLAMTPRPPLAVLQSCTWTPVWIMHCFYFHTCLRDHKLFEGKNHTYSQNARNKECNGYLVQLLLLQMRKPRVKGVTSQALRNIESQWKNKTKIQYQNDRKHSQEADSPDLFSWPLLGFFLLASNILSLLNLVLIKWNKEKFCS